MKDSDIQRLVEKLQEDNKKNKKAALEELYDAAKKGEDISTAVTSLRMLITTQFFHKKIGSEKPDNWDWTIPREPVSPSTDFFKYGPRALTPDPVTIPPKPEVIMITAASVLAIHYVNTGEIEKIIELLEYQPSHLGSLYAFGLPKINMVSHPAAYALKDYGFDKIPAEERMRIKVMALTTLGSDEDINELLDIGEEAISIVINMHKKRTEQSKSSEFFLHGSLSLPNTLRVIMHAAKEKILLSDEGMKLLGEAVNKCMSLSYVNEPSLLDAAELLVSTYLGKDDISAIAEMMEQRRSISNYDLDTSRAGARGKISKMIIVYLEKKGLSFTINSLVYSGIRDAALGVLNKFMHEGTDISPAVPALIDCLSEKNLDLNRKEIKILGKIGDDRAIPVLLDVLNGKNSELWVPAAEALDKIGYGKISMDDKVFALLICNKIDDIAKIGKPAVLTLINLFKNRKNRDIRYYAIRSLRKIGDERAVPALIDALKDYVPGVPVEAAEALEEIAEKTADSGDYYSALKIIKNVTAKLMTFYPKKKDRYLMKKRREWLKPFAEITQKIHDKMTSDKKTFHKPVKHQPVRTVRKKVIANG